MRWVKTAIAIIIVLAIIPAIVKGISDLTTGKEGYEGEYEIILTDENINETIHEFVKYVETDEENNVTNCLEIELDGSPFDVLVFKFDGDYFHLVNKETDIMIGFNIGSPILGRYVDDYLKITLYVNIPGEEPVLSPTEIILISLIPLIIVSGLLAYQYKELKIRKE